MSKIFIKKIICDKNEGKMMCEFQFGHISSPFSSKERLKGNSELQSVIAIAAFMGLKTTFFWPLPKCTAINYFGQFYLNIGILNIVI
jgi:hypothetical protein